MVADPAEGGGRRGAINDSTKSAVHHAEDIRGVVFALLETLGRPNPPNLTSLLPIRCRSNLYGESPVRDMSPTI